MDVSTLTRLEQDIVAQVRAARAYILGPSAPQAVPTAQVRAEVLRELLLGGLQETVNGAVRTVSPGAIGVQVRGVWVDGDLDLADAEREGMALPALVLEGCLIPGVIQLANAHLSRLSLAGSRIVALDAAGARIDGDVNLNDIASAEDAAHATGATFDGRPAPRCSVRLAGARVGGELRVERAKLAAPPQTDPDFIPYALDGASLTLANGVTAQPGLVALGGMRLRSARIGGDIWMVGAVLKGQGEGCALNGYGVEIRGNLAAQQSTADKLVALGGARVHGDLDLSGVKIEPNHEGDCLVLGGATFDGMVRLNGAALAPPPAAESKPEEAQAAAAAPAPPPAAPPAPRFAIYAANAVFKQNLEVDLLESRGVIELAGASVNGKLVLACPNLSTRFRDVVSAADIDVERSVFLSGVFVGAVNFERARIRGEFEIGALELVAGARKVAQLSLRDARINGVLQIAPNRAKARTEPLDDFQSVLRARVTPAPFYPGWSVVDVYCRRNGEEAARALLWDGADDVVLLDSQSRTLHDFNDGNLGRSGGGRSRLRLRNPREIEAYLKFFCGVIQGDGGAFRIVSSVRGRDEKGNERRYQERPVAKLQSPRAAKGDDGAPPITATALVSYEGALFKAKFGIQRAGGVEMLDDLAIAHHIDPPKIDYKSSPGWRCIREQAGAPGVLKGLPPLYESDWRDLGDADVRRILKAWRFYIAPEIDLSGLDVAAFEDGDGENWGEAFKFELEGVSFQRFAADKRAAKEKSGVPPDPGAAQASGAEEQEAALELSLDSAEARLKWLSRQSRIGQGWSPQPHEAFAQVYRRHGHMSDSIRILVDKAERDLDKHFPRLWRPLRALYRGFMKAFWGGGFRYGLSPPHALATCMVCLAIGWIGVEAANNGRPAPPLVDFSRDGPERTALVIDSTPIQSVAFSRGGDIALGVQQTDIAPISDVPCGHSITPWIYAADVFIPLLDLRQESACSVRSDAWAAPWRWLKALYAGLGWVIISLSILTWSGALRRQTGA